MLSIHSDEYFMQMAIKEAMKAASHDEVPVGAVVVWNKQIIAKAYNQTESLNDPTAHAEMIAITAAANHIGSKYLDECELFVTLEPCVMCGGAAFWARLKKISYGASDDRRGFMRLGTDIVHPKASIQYGLLERECSQLIKAFFAKKR